LSAMGTPGKRVRDVLLDSINVGVFPIDGKC